ncbi:MAG: hypothetical protein ACXAB7_15800 [Candidatus Kariarchaeaceae archaeon]
MYSRYANSIDHHIVYRISSALVFVFYLSRVVLPSKENKILLFPNVPFTILCWILTLILTFVAQELQPTQHSKRWLINRIALATIPPLLGAVLVIRWINTQKDQDEDVSIYAGAYLLVAVFVFLSINMVGLLVLITIDGKIQGHSIYLASLGIWGMIGITIGDLDVLGRNEKRKKQTKDLISSSPLITRKQRVLLLGAIFALLLLLSFTTNTDSLDPITY